MHLRVQGTQVSQTTLDGYRLSELTVTERKRRIRKRDNGPRFKIKTLQNEHKQFTVVHKQGNAAATPLPGLDAGSGKYRVFL